MANQYSSEQLKTIATIMQQSVLLVNAHSKAATALAHFEMEVCNDDRSIHINEEDETITREFLRESVRLASQNMKLVSQVEAIL